MRKKLTIEEVIKRVNLAHGDLVSLNTDTYVDTHTPCQFIHKIYGTWIAVPKDVFSGHSHMRAGVENRKKTCLEKYGVDNPLKYGIFKEKSKKTSLDRYGVEYPMKNKEIRDRADATVLEKYGVKNISQSDEIKAKKIETTFKNFGVQFTTQSEKIKNKIIRNNIDKYGVAYPIQVPEIAAKMAKSSNESYVTKNWKTNKEIVCVGTWEVMVVDYLNANKINFDWQPKTFSIPKEVFVTEKNKQATYRPDLYLIDQDIWVEIKGWFRGDAQIKWDWFKSVYPTAELWDKKKLKEMGIL